jgi:hypothetical protein
MLQTAYLLRFWRTSLRDDWRATLIAVGEETREQHFANLDDLYHHLQETYALHSEADERRNKPNR